VRASSLLRQILGISGLVVRSFQFRDDVGLVCAVEPTARRSRCAACGRKCPRYDRHASSLWRHLNAGCTRVFVEYAPWRVTCRRCGTGPRVERLPWATAGSRFTYLFEDVVGWLVQHNDKTAVTALMGIAWRTVGRIVERVVARRRDAVDFRGLRAISIDELSWRKGHRYLTLVVDLDTQRVVWGMEGKTSEAAGAFFAEIGEDARAAIEHVAIDMSAAYRKAITEWLPHAKIVYDRFHVQQLVGDAVDEVRRIEWRSLQGTREGSTIKGLRYPLLKQPWMLSDDEASKLAELQVTNRRLFRAYLLKETICHIFRGLPTPRTAATKLAGWLDWASRSRLAPFVRVAQTIRSCLDGVLGYFETGFTTSPHEGMNNKARLATRQAYGFHSARAALAIIDLRCTGLHIPLPVR